VGFLTALKKSFCWYHVILNQKTKARKTLLLERQIPVCLKHHSKIHSGKYDGPSVKRSRLLRTHIKIKKNKNSYSMFYTKLLQGGVGAQFAFKGA